MKMDGMKPTRLGSLEDRLYTSAFYRRKQSQLFETMIAVYSRVLQLDPKIAKTVESLTKTYFDLEIPGINEYLKKSEDSFVKKQQDALTNIMSRLDNYNAMLNK